MNFLKRIFNPDSTVSAVILAAFGTLMVFCATEDKINELNVEKRAELSEIRQLISSVKSSNNKYLMSTLARKLEDNPTPLKLDLKKWTNEFSSINEAEKKERQRQFSFKKIQPEIQSLRQ